MDQSSSNAGPFKPGFYVVDDIRRMSPEAIHLHLTMRSPAWQPPTDVYENEETVIVRVEIAGMNETDFSIVLDGRYLSIRGVRQDIPERRAYHQMEIRFGEFNVDIELPAVVDVESVQAIYQNGFLKITLPKVHTQIE